MQASFLSDKDSGATQQSHRAALGFVIALIVFAVEPLSARADKRTQALDKQSYEMYQQVFSPFCPGRSLNDCPSSKAHELKVEMRVKLEQGVPEQQILSEVFEKFGDKYRAVPLFEGIGRWVWLAPMGFLLLGILIITGVVFRRKKSVFVPVKTADSAIPAQLQRQIEEEISKLD